jgi:hypothetical protein
MNIQEVIRTINQMQADGVIEAYAIGGAVGATFHLEPPASLSSTAWKADVPPRTVCGQIHNINVSVGAK